MEGPNMSGMNQTGGSMMGGMMKPWLHFTRGDAVLFMNWVPATPGAVGGACIGLFLLAIVERLLAAVRSIMHVYWARKTKELLASRLTNVNDDTSTTTTEKKRSSTDNEESAVEALPVNPSMRNSSGRIADLRREAPFIPTHDLARGTLYACQATLSYALMLVVMTFHAGYIISIIVGFGVGQVLFGRFGSGAYV